MDSERSPLPPSFRRTGRRLLQLWWLYARMDLIWMLRSWKSFVMYALSDLVMSAAAVTSILLLAERFHHIGEWTQDEIVFMLSYSMLSSGLLQLFFNFNLGYISRRIGRGQLDHLLIQPQPLWVCFVTEGFLPLSGSGVVLMGAAALIWSIRKLHLAVTPGWLLLLALNLASSTIVVVSFSYCWSTLAFWAPRGAEEISSSTMRLIDQLRLFPLDGLGPAAITGLLAFVPAGFAAWFPSRALLGLDPHPWAAGVTPAAAILFLAAAFAIFRLGLREYGRTGSQRYSSFGHRR